MVSGICVALSLVAHARAQASVVVSSKGELADSPKQLMRNKAKKAQAQVQETQAATSTPAPTNSIFDGFGEHVPPVKNLNVSLERCQLEIFKNLAANATWGDARQVFLNRCLNPPHGHPADVCDNMA